MVKNSKQQWDVGATVKIGFVSGLLILAAIPTPGDYAPDEYILRRGESYYRFVPHNGLSKISRYEADELMGPNGQ